MSMSHQNTLRNQHLSIWGSFTERFLNLDAQDISISTAGPRPSIIWVLILSRIRNLESFSGREWRLYYFWMLPGSCLLLAPSRRLMSAPVSRIASIVTRILWRLMRVTTQSSVTPSVRREGESFIWSAEASVVILMTISDNYDEDFKISPTHKKGVSSCESPSSPVSRLPPPVLCQHKEVSPPHLRQETQAAPPLSRQYLNVMRIKPIYVAG